MTIVNQNLEKTQQPLFGGRPLSRESCQNGMRQARRGIGLGFGQKTTPRSKKNELTAEKNEALEDDFFFFEGKIAF